MRAERSMDANGLSLEKIAGPALAAAIHFSRWRAMQYGTRAVPKHVEEVLAPHYPPGMLSRVRWLTLDHELHGVKVRPDCLGREGGMTLADLIVFSSETAANDLGLWAHELAHVEQFDRMGIAGFAHRYSGDWRRIEQEANTKARRIVEQTVQLASADPGGSDRSKRRPRQSSTSPVVL